MWGTPFAVFDIIIAFLGRGCKCAILILLLPLQIDNGSRNLTQAGFRNIACRRTEGVDGVAGVKVGYIAEILKVKIFVRVQSAAGEKHIRHAVLQGGLVFHFNIEAVKFL
ncbi:MAG: hypothetical protein LBQ15_02940 [Clostridium sp.]|nr:hypothetical protein [Clostridium sp.]